MSRTTRRDLLGAPAYTHLEAARFLAVPRSTIHSWVTGRPHFHRVVTPAAPGGLSFTNLVELHVLSALRGRHVKMAHIRKAVQLLRVELKTEHPLAAGEFFTLGKELFVDHLGRLAHITGAVQLVMKQVLADYLSRVERNAAGVPVRLYPCIPNKPDVRSVVIDPAVAFGRPRLAAVGIPTTEIVQRWLGGDELPFIAEDLGVSVDVVSDALRFEMPRAA